MGQFVVVNNPTAINEPQQAAKDFSLYPNPSSDKLYISLNDPAEEVYYIRINNAVGRTIYMLPRPQFQNGIDISNLSAGVYFLQLTDEKTKITTTKKFVKE